MLVLVVADGGGWKIERIMLALPASTNAGRTSSRSLSGVLRLATIKAFNFLEDLAVVSWDLIGAMFIAPTFNVPF